MLCIKLIVIIVLNITFIQLLSNIHLHKYIYEIKSYYIYIKYIYIYSNYAFIYLAALIINRLILNC